MKNTTPLVCIVLLVSGCSLFMSEERLEARRAAQAEKEAIEQAIDSAIVFSVAGVSPKWDELSRKIIPRRINKKARFNIVDNDPKKHPKYRLTVHYVNTAKDVTGSDSKGGAVGGGYGGVVGVSGRSRTKIKTMTTIEAVAVLTGVDDKQLWSWSGFSEDEKDADAVEKIGDKIADELSKAGYLDGRKFVSGPLGLK